MAEQITLTNPVVIPQKTTSTWKVVHLLLFVGQQRFNIVVESNQGETIEAHRSGQIATDLMRILNKANGSVKSLEKRAMEWLQTQPEGVTLIGTVTGTPD